MAHPSVIDRFTILRPVGTGGMGTVYEAIDPTIDRRVAIKLLHHDVLMQNPEVIERLWIEARAANRIGHSGVVQVSEAGKLADGTGYLVMEFLEGLTLRERLQQASPGLSLQDALQIAIQIASTLNAGHQKGIVHRDLKPDNVMLVLDDAVTNGERVKLLDFGIAKIVTPLSQTTNALTVGDMGLGTPGYMAPEQLCNAASATDRTDVYALGSVLFEMLAGRRPYVAPSTAELLVLVMSQDAPLVTEFVPEVAPVLAQLIAAMLVRSPADHRPLMADVLRDLLRFSGVASGRRPPVAGRAPVDPGSGRSAPVGLTPDTSTKTPSGYGESAPNAVLPVPPRNRRRSSAAVLAVVVCLGLGIVLAVWRGPKHQHQTPPPAGQPSSLANRTPEPAVTKGPTEPTPPILVPRTVAAPPLVALVDNPPPVDKPSLAEPPLHTVAKPHLVLRTLVDSDCLPALPSNLRGALVKAARGAGLRLLPKQSVVLTRQGNHNFVFSSEHGEELSAAAYRDFETILRSQLKNVVFPQNIKRIPIRCRAK